MGAFCSGPRLGLVTPRAGSKVCAMYSYGKGHLGPRDDLGQYSVCLSYPSQGDPLQLWKALCCCGNGGELGVRPCAWPATPAPSPRLEDLGLGKAQTLVGKYIKLSWASIPLSLQLKAL